MDFQSLTASGTSTLSDHYSETNIDSLLVEKASLANPSFVGTVTTPNLTVVDDATANEDSTVNWNLLVFGIGKMIRARRIAAPSANRPTPLCPLP